ncbi:MAG TPA: 3-isopropylmalate dehydratase large subunit [Bacillota bacterium]|nr:3-isopropylmalate dehydratase large subunit [Bacillota bacterium]
MGMTMTQKILASKAGLDSVKAGQLIKARLDMVLANDITAPVSINEFEKAGFDSVFDKNRISLVMDHFAPNKDIKAAQQCKQCRTFAKKFDIENFYDVGEMGIEHALLPEKGLVAPGEAVIGADSHTCTYGALNAFSTGVGSTDLAAGIKTGQAWFKVPSAVKFDLRSNLSEGVGGKDVILHIIGKIGVDGALYKSMEFMGEGLSSLSMDDRFTIANMAIEAGAKNGIFKFDDLTRSYTEEHIKNASGGFGERKWISYDPDPDAIYEETHIIDLSDIRPTVAFPSLPQNAVTVDEIESLGSCGKIFGITADKKGRIRLDQVVIGSCTNGRLSDMAAAAGILKGTHIAKDVRVIIIPATQKIYRECISRGYMETFIDAGCVVSTPTCGPCLGGHMGILAQGERCLATTNRNFVGRMGHPDSEIFLSGPQVAAASAICGYIKTPEGEQK